MMKRNWKAKTTTVATILLGASLLMGGQAYAASNTHHHHGSHSSHHHMKAVDTYSQNDQTDSTVNGSNITDPSLQTADNTNTNADNTVNSSATNANSGNVADRIIADGLRYKGTPYKFGSSKNTTGTFDCSSFTQHVFKDVGITLPRDSRQQSQVGQQVSINNLQKGDLIFFRSYNSSSSRITHVAIYAGNDTILHTYGKPGVTTSKFFGTSWEKRFVIARRVI